MRPGTVDWKAVSRDLLDGGPVYPRLAPSGEAAEVSLLEHRFDAKPTRKDVSRVLWEWRSSRTIDRDTLVLRLVGIGGGATMLVAGAWTHPDAAARRPFRMMGGSHVAATAGTGN